jgi:hypothetical protein
MIIYLNDLPMVWLVPIQTPGLGSTQSRSAFSCLTATEPLDSIQAHIFDAKNACSYSTYYYTANFNVAPLSEIKIMHGKIFRIPVGQTSIFPNDTIKTTNTSTKS